MIMREERYAEWVQKEAIIQVHKLCDHSARRRWTLMERLRLAGVRRESRMLFPEASLVGPDLGPVESACDQ
jgi:hypothetical protein